jgi:hypothetical protein
MPTQQKEWQMNEHDENRNLGLGHFADVSLRKQLDPLSGGQTAKGQPGFADQIAIGMATDIAGSRSDEMLRHGYQSNLAEAQSQNLANELAASQPASSPGTLPFRESSPTVPPNSAIARGARGQAGASTNHQAPGPPLVNTKRTEPSVGRVPQGSLTERVQETLRRNAELEAIDRATAARQQSLDLQAERELDDSFLALQSILRTQSTKINVALGVSPATHELWGMIPQTPPSNANNAPGRPAQGLTYLPMDTCSLTCDGGFHIRFDGRTLAVSLNTTNNVGPNDQGRIAILISTDAPGTVSWGGKYYHIRYVLRKTRFNTIEWAVEPQGHDGLSINWFQTAEWLLDALMQRDFLARSVNHRGEPTVLPPFTAKWLR